MNDILQTPEFKAWLKTLRDYIARTHIANRIDRAKKGLFGDCQPVGGGISEMRIHYGPGYRLYFAQKGATIYLLLLGGEKSTQSRDIIRAKALWAQVKGETP